MRELCTDCKKDDDTVRSVVLLDASAKLRKRVYCVSRFCRYVRPPAVTRLPKDGFSSKLVFEYFSTICTDNINFFKIWEEQLLYNKPFVMISGWIFLRMKNILNVVEKIKTHILCSITIFRKSSFYEMVWKNVVEPEGPQMAMLNGACAWRAAYVCCALNPLQQVSSFIPII